MAFIMRRRGTREGGTADPRATGPLVPLPDPAHRRWRQSTEGTAMDMSGITIFIPGATSGIGLALALRLQEAGNTVVIGGRRTDVLEQIATEHGFGIVTIDTTDP